MDLGPKLLMSTDNSPLLQSTSSPIPTESAKTDEEIESNYEIVSCADWILAQGFQTVALQFPDSMLADSARVSDLLEKGTRFKPFILADTSYGSCCVDEVAAQHINAQCILHYGDACMSATEGRIPTRYVFPKSSFDEQSFRDQISQLAFEFANGEGVNLVIDVCAGHLSEAIARIIETSVSKPCHVTSLMQRHDAVHFPSVSNPILFVGETRNNPRLILLMMANPGRTFFSYDFAFKVLRKENVDVNRMLRRRLFLVEKAKDAQIVGIVVGALSVGGYLQVVDRVKSLCRKAGKKFIVLSVGKLNVAKLSNFAGSVDVFVWISCPFNIMLETSEYPHPILTPFEMEVACDPKTHWYADSGWVTDLKELLETQNTEAGSDDTGEDTLQETDVSLITGRLRRMVAPEDNTSDNALISRSDAMQLQPVSIESRFGEKSWKGLEERLGETPVAKVREGRRGIASGYEGEAGAKSESRFGEKSWKGLEERLGETPVAKVREGRRGIASGYEGEADMKPADT